MKFKCSLDDNNLLLYDNFLVLFKLIIVDNCDKMVIYLFENN